MAKTMPWGKYKGEPLDEVPLGYVAWLFEQWLENPGKADARVALELFETFLDQVTEIPAFKDALGARVEGPAPVVNTVVMGRHQFTPAQMVMLIALVKLGYKRMAADLHPDHGGDPEQMTVLNQVKDILDKTFSGGK